MNLKVVFLELIEKITLRESEDEIRSMALILMEEVLGISKTDIMAGKVVAMTTEAEQRLQSYINRINANEPVQYVVGEAWFYGRKFQVNPSVLIPRPETEEIIRSVLRWRYSPKQTRNNNTPRILDIGTGSGCIPITLSLEWSGAELFATDISTAALSVGVGNAERYDAHVSFIEHDILTEDIPVANLDVITSNPPYVRDSEKHVMASNVIDFEPRIALFVNDDDPVLFYRNIIRRSIPVLNPGGFLAMEINEQFGKEVLSLLVQNGFQEGQIIKDVSGKDRVVTGVQPPR